MNFKAFMSLQFSVVSLTFTEVAFLGSDRALHTLPLCLLSMSVLTSEPKFSSNFNPFSVFFSPQLSPLIFCQQPYPANCQLPSSEVSSCEHP